MDEAVDGTGSTTTDRTSTGAIPEQRTALPVEYTAPPAENPAAPAQRSAPPELPAPGAARPCRCGHGHEAHEHYRPGTECSTCGCARFRRARPSLRAVLPRRSG